MALASALLVAVGLALALVAWLAQGRVLERRVPERPAQAPVSILRPLKGLDPALRANLDSLLDLGHPCEIVLAVADADDPALPAARDWIEAHPEARARLVVSGRRVGLNPKVDNLANAAAVARHELLLVSDSNVRLSARALAAMLSERSRGADLVSSLIRGVAGEGLGGAVERLQLNTFVMGGVAAWSRLGRPCVVGKSMLMSRATLADIGGWEHLGRFLAEDQACGEAVARRGRVAVSAPIDNTLGRLSMSDACRRHLRWARIRSRISPAGYAGELLLNPVGVAMVALAVAPGAAGLRVLALALGAMSLLAWDAERRLGVRRRAWAVPALELLRAGMVLALWPIAPLSAHVTWRGRRHRIGPRTELLPVRVPQQSPLSHAPAAETVS